MPAPDDLKGEIKLEILNSLEKLLLNGVIITPSPFASELAAIQGVVAAINAGHTVHPPVIPFNAINTHLAANPNPTLQNFFNDLDPKIDAMYDAHDRNAFKIAYHDIMDHCVNSGIPLGEPNRTLPLIWTNDGTADGGLTERTDVEAVHTNYTQHISDDLSPALQIANSCFWKIIEAPNPVPPTGNYREQLKQENENFLATAVLGTPEIPMLRIMSEVFTEHFDLRSIADGLRIESGQNVQDIYKAGVEAHQAPLAGVPPAPMPAPLPASAVATSSDACLFENELPIILARVAKYNCDKRILGVASDRLRGYERIRPDATEIDLTDAVQIQTRGIVIDHTTLNPPPTVGHIMQPGDLVTIGPSYSTTALEVGPTVVPIQTLLGYVEQATQRENRMLTVQETLQAIKHGGTLVAPAHDARAPELAALSAIVSDEMIARASAQPILVRREQRDSAAVGHFGSDV